MSKSDNAAWKTAEADSAAQRHMGVRPSLVPTGETGVLIRLTPVGAPDPVVSIGRLHALSPVGIEVNCDQVPLWLNQEVYVAFEYQGQMIQGLCFFVSSEALDQGSILFLRWCPDFLEGDKSEKRMARRWATNPGFRPTGVGSNPFRFNDQIFFRVTEVSANGLHFETSLRNRLLIPGMTFSAIVHFPACGQIVAEMRIVRVEVKESEGIKSLSVGAKWNKLKEFERSVIAQYVVQFSGRHSLEVLKEEGLFVKKIGDKVEWDFVQSREDYEAVVQLRAEAYGKVGKLSTTGAPLDSMKDRFDSRAKIITGKFHGKVVASMRLMFPENQEDETEHEAFVPWNDSLPSKSDLVEISRVCTDSNYRGVDLLWTLVSQGCLASLLSGRRYVLGSSTRSLLKMYEKIGYRAVSAPYVNEKLGSKEHLLILCETKAVVCGYRVNPLVWNLLIYGLFRYALRNHLISLSPRDGIRVLGYLAVRPFALLLARFLAQK